MVEALVFSTMANTLCLNADRTGLSSEGYVYEKTERTVARNMRTLKCTIWVNQQRLSSSDREKLKWHFADFCLCDFGSDDDTRIDLSFTYDERKGQKLDALACEMTELFLNWEKLSRICALSYAGITAPGKRALKKDTMITAVFWNCVFSTELFISRILRSSDGFPNYG